MNIATFRQVLGNRQTEQRRAADNGNPSSPDAGRTSKHSERCLEQPPTRQVFIRPERGRLRGYSMLRVRHERVGAQAKKPLMALRCLNGGMEQTT